MNNQSLSIFTPVPSLSLPTKQFIEELDLPPNQAISSLLEQSRNQDVLSTSVKTLGWSEKFVSMKILKKQYEALQQVLCDLNTNKTRTFRHLADILQLKSTLCENAIDLLIRSSFNENGETIFNEIFKSRDCLIKDLTKWTEQKITLVEKQAVQDHDFTLLKVIEVAKNIQNELEDLKLTYQARNPKAVYTSTSCGLTSWAIGRKISQAEGKFDPKLNVSESTKQFRTQLGRGDENVYVCDISLSSRHQHSFVIQEKRDGDRYKYRLYFSYIDIFGLNEYLSVCGIDTETKGWMTDEAIQKFLDKIDRFVETDKIWTLKDIEDFYNCFGEKLWNMEGKKTLCPSEDPGLKQQLEEHYSIHAFSFYSLRKQKDDQFILANERNLENPRVNENDYKNFVKVLVVFQALLIVTLVVNRINKQ